MASLLIGRQKQVHSILLSWLDNDTSIIVASYYSRWSVGEHTWYFDRGCMWREIEIVEVIDVYTIQVHFIGWIKNENKIVLCETDSWFWPNGAADRFANGPAEIQVKYRKDEKSSWKMVLLQSNQDDVVKLLERNCIAPALSVESTQGQSFYLPVVSAFQDLPIAYFLRNDDCSPFLQSQYLPWIKELHMSH